MDSHGKIWAKYMKQPEYLVFLIELFQSFEFGCTSLKFLDIIYLILSENKMEILFYNNANIKYSQAPGNKRIQVGTDYIQVLGNTVCSSLLHTGWFTMVLIHKKLIDQLVFDFSQLVPYIMQGGYPFIFSKNQILAVLVTGNQGWVSTHFFKNQLLAMLVTGSQGWVSPHFP